MDVISTKRTGSSALGIVQELQSLGRVESIRDRDVKKIALALLALPVRGEDSGEKVSDLRRQKTQLDKVLRDLVRDNPVLAVALVSRAEKTMVDNAEEGKAINFLVRMLTSGIPTEINSKGKTVKEKAPKAAPARQAEAKSRPLPQRQPQVMETGVTLPRFESVVSANPVVVQVKDNTNDAVSKPSKPQPPQLAQHTVSAPLVQPNPEREDQADLNRVAEILERLLCPSGAYSQCSLEQLKSEAEKGMQEAIWVAAELASRFPNGGTLVIDHRVLEKVACSGRPFQPTTGELVLWRDFDDLWSAIRSLYHHENSLPRPLAT